MRAARIGWTAVAAVLVAGAVVAAVGLRPRPVAEQQPVALSTATVERGDLVETRTIDGELGYGPATELPTTLEGTVTWLPAAGAAIGRDSRLYAIDMRPVILLVGSLPAWRNLAPGVEGRDVRQLEENLRALGYEGFTVDNRYTSRTAAAVRDWQQDHALLRTGEVELGRVVFWPTAVRVDTVEATPGKAIVAGDVVLHHTGTARNVYAELEVEQAGLARAGANVQLAVPGRPAIQGRISRIGNDIAQPATTESEAPAPEEPMITLTITIANQQALGTITGAPVDVQLVGDRRNDVLTVPVAALLALREGGHGLEIVDGDRRSIVPVETGLFAAGRVEVSGAGIEAGTVVGMAA
ncbi:peptidoglycan-binding protein [Tenggerimyces flavus]|uniref:Peptidoglycan-binding protein n=1 Tax=Tenggerimyces flavus TaxID=1708749 RepID=A0ABV7YCW4_9ACTN|nr:peptidoglycan-binding domain-containing protein [Tenggerimyces flavus]MBM7789774.1 peptidoglycan hydrolase-like protein with peptidoglycan-binding domain [Tenggerimyces flavus]